MNIKKISIFPVVVALFFLGFVSIGLTQTTQIGNNLIIGSDLTLPSGHVGVGGSYDNNWKFLSQGGQGNRILTTHNNGHGAFIASSGGNYILRLRNEDTGVNAFDFNANGSMVAQGDVRAPIFYDSQNTNYYINPSASTISARFNGRVGIGSASSPGGSSYVSIRDSGDQRIHIESTNNARASLFITGGTGSVSWDINAHNDGYFRIREDGVQTPLIINSGNGFVSLGVGPTTDRRLLLPNQSNNNGRAIANQWNTYSSQRYKENITPLSTEEAMDKIMNLNPVSFNWKEEYGGSYDIGFIAEEVGTIIPEAVEWDEDGEYADGLSTQPLISYLTKIAQIQKQEIKDLEERISKLENN